MELRRTSSITMSVEKGFKRIPGFAGDPQSPAPPVFPRALALGRYRASPIPRALNLAEREEGHGKLSRAKRGTFEEKSLSQPWFPTLAAIGEQDRVLYIRKAYNKALCKAYSLYIYRC